MVQRALDAVLAALTMDPSRRDLFVEGPTDRLFILWLAGDQRADDVAVQDAESLAADVDGGNKGKLLALSRMIGPTDRVVVFVDADYDRQLGRSYESPVLLTDMNDMDAYVLTEFCTDKVLRLGLATESIHAKDLLSQALVAARKVGLLRLTSEIHDLKLPFGKVKVSGSVEIEQGSVTFKMTRYLAAVVGQAGGGGKTIKEVQSLLDATTQDAAGVADMHVVRGHDVLDIIGEYLRKRRVDRRDVPRLFRTSFERTLATEHPNLSMVLQFVSAT